MMNLTFGDGAEWLWGYQAFYWAGHPFCRIKSTKTPVKASKGL